MFMLQAKWMIPDFLGVNVKTVFLPSVRVIFFSELFKDHCAGATPVLRVEYQFYG